MAMSLATVRHTQAASVPTNASVFCREQLKKIEPQKLAHLSEGFVHLRDQTNKTKPHNGKLTPEIASLLGIGVAKNNKSFFWEKLWWGEEEKNVKPNLKALGPKMAEWSKTVGIDVPQYRGEMLFAGDDINARLSVKLLDNTKAVDPKDLKAVPTLKSTGEVKLTIHDTKGTLSETQFKEWAEALLKSSQISDVAFDAKNPHKEYLNLRPNFSIEKTPRKDGTNDYSIHIKNMILPFFRLSWFVENVQRSLAEQDYRATRLKMHEERGIASFKDNELPPPPLFPAKSKDSALRYKPIITESAWEWLDRSENKTDSEQSKSKKPLKKFERTRKSSFLDE